MAWQVALFLGTQIERSSVERVLGMMPVWARWRAELASAAPELWKNWNTAWEPEPALTLFISASGTNVLEEIRNQVLTAEEHFPNLNCVRLLGVDQSDALSHTMTELEYVFVSGGGYPGLAFARSIDHFQNLRELDLDAALWQSAEDFYRDFFKAVEAPEWHGHNFNALIDSIGTGAINQIEVPYRLVVRNARKASGNVRKFLEELLDVFRLLQSDGCPVDLRLME